MTILYYMRPRYMDSGFFTVPEGSYVKGWHKKKKKAKRALKALTIKPPPERMATLPEFYPNLSFAKLEKVDLRALNESDRNKRRKAEYQILLMLMRLEEDL